MRWKTKHRMDTDTVRMLKKIQEQNTNDEYSCGLLNGIELALAVLEERKPEFKEIEKETQAIDRTNEKKQTGRTLYSGERRVSKENE
jgi:hypothetical protein